MALSSATILKNGNWKGRNGRSKIFYFQTASASSHDRGTKDSRLASPLRTSITRGALTIRRIWNGSNKRESRQERTVALGRSDSGMEERQGKLLLIGNLLHADGLLARMKPKMQKVLEYSLVKTISVVIGGHVGTLHMERKISHAHLA